MNVFWKSVTDKYMQNNAYDDATCIILTTDVNWSQNYGQSGRLMLAYSLIHANLLNRVQISSFVTISCPSSHGSTAIPS